MERESAQFTAIFDQLGHEVLTRLEMVPLDALSFPLPFFGESLALLALHFIEAGEFWVRDVVGGQHWREEDPVPLSSQECWPELTTRFIRWLQTMHVIMDELPDGAMELSIVLPTNVREEMGSEMTNLRHCLLHLVVLQATTLGRIQTICQMMADGERIFDMVIQEQELLS